MQKKINKKGQMDYPIITFVVLIIFLLIFGPIFIKMLTQTKETLSPALGNQTYGEVAQQTTDSIINTTISFSDKMMIFLFVIFIIVLIVSSVLIDTHPFWIFLYIFISFLFIITAPNIIESLDTIYESGNFVNEVNQLNFLVWLKDNFGSIIVGVMVLTGIIIYGKIALFRNSGGGRE